MREAPTSQFFSSRGKVTVTVGLRPMCANRARGDADHDGAASNVTEHDRARSDDGVGAHMNSL